MSNARVNNFDAHAHSPRRPGSNATQKARELPKPTVTSSPASLPLHASKWAPGAAKKAAAIDDPFVEPSQKPKSQLLRRTNVDVSMKDASASSKNVSEMSGVEMEQPGLEQFVNRADVEEILGVLTPAKRSSLLHALLPLKQGTAKNATDGISKLLMASSADNQPQSGCEGADRQCSNESRRTTSGHSGKMSWEETPTLGELWSGTNTEYPGLLPTLVSSSSKNRSDSVRSKRRRSQSPVARVLSGSGIRLSTRGMSTSPCKATPSPAKVDREDSSTITVHVGNKSQTGMTKPVG